LDKELSNLWAFVTRVTLGDLSLLVVFYQQNDDIKS